MNKMRRLTKKQRKEWEGLKKLQVRMATRVLGAFFSLIILGWWLWNLWQANAGLRALAPVCTIVLATFIFGSRAMAKGRSIVPLLEALEFGIYNARPDTIMSAFLHQLDKAGTAMIRVPDIGVRIEAYSYDDPDHQGTEVGLRYLYRGKTKAALNLSYQELKQKMTSRSAEAKAFRGNETIAWRKLAYFIKNYRRVKARLAKK